MKFKDLKFRTWTENANQCKQARVTLENGYAVSVVRHNFSYGGNKGLYEIGVFNADTNNMVDPLDWGDTVKGWLLPSDVEQELELIKELYLLCVFIFTLFFNNL